MSVYENPFGHFGGIEVHISHAMARIIGYDFSKCRSPSRAERRYRKRRILNKHMVPIYKSPDERLRIGNKIFMAPDTYLRFRALINQEDGSQ